MAKQVRDTNNRILQAKPNGQAEESKPKMDGQVQVTLANAPILTAKFGELMLTELRAIRTLLEKNG